MADQRERSDYVELVPLQPEQRSLGVVRSQSRMDALRSFALTNWLALSIFVLPTLLAALYFGLLLAPRYAAEAQFVVRSGGSPSSQLTQMLASVGGDEANMVQAYVESRDAVAHLEQTVGLRTLLARPEADVFWRFPTLLGREDAEALFEHYRSFVQIKFDESTGISTLSTQGFWPGDAVDIARGLLEGAERLINRLNEESRADTLRSAQEEIAFARKRAEAAREAMTEYRVNFGIFDPTASSATLAKTIGDLSLERARLEAELLQLMGSSPLNPQISGLRNRIAALEAQIAAERAQISGADQSLAERITEFERLALEREFADRALASALASFEAARREAQSTRLYIELVVEPREADYPEYPKRFLSILLALAAFFAVNVILSAFATNLYEHRSR